MGVPDRLVTWHLFVQMFFEYQFITGEAAHCMREDLVAHGSSPPSSLPLPSSSRPNPHPSPFIAEPAALLTPLLQRWLERLFLLI